MGKRGVASLNMILRTAKHNNQTQNISAGKNEYKESNKKEKTILIIMSIDINGERGAEIKKKIISTSISGAANGTPPSRANAHSWRDAVVTDVTDPTKTTMSAAHAMAIIAARLLLIVRRYMPMNGKSACGVPGVTSAWSVASLPAVKQMVTTATTPISALAAPLPMIAREIVQLASYVSSPITITIRRRRRNISHIKTVFPDNETGKIGTGTRIKTQWVRRRRGVEKKWLSNHFAR
jgi:hypothetical protein